MARNRGRLYAFLIARCEEIGLDREDRMELVREMFDGYPDGIESFTDLTDSDLEDLRFFLRSYGIVHRLRRANGSLTAEAELLMARMTETAEETATRQNESGEWE